MANPELELISNIIHHGSLTEAKKKGVTPDFFSTEEAGLVFQWLWDQFHSAEHRGEVPDKGRLIRKFPDFPWCPSRNAITALIGDLEEDRLAFDIETITGEMQGLVESGEDPRLVLQAFMPQLRDLSVQSSDQGGGYMRDAFGELRQDYETTKNSGGITGIPFPWAPLNKATGGMHSEDFIVLYGRPKNMKTWGALAIAAHAYQRHTRVYIFSKEMRVLTMQRRMASLLAGLDYSKIKEGTLSPEEEEDYFGTLADLGEFESTTIEGGNRTMDLFFDSDKGRREASTVDSLIARAERFMPDLLMVDGLYLMRDQRSKSRAVDWKNVAHISQDLKGAAQYLECALLGTTQANRQGSKTVTDEGTDLSYADSLFQDADLAMRVFKGPNPSGNCKYAIALTFPGVREADLHPFLISANPGSDFGLLQQRVDMTSFLGQKQAMDRDEDTSHTSTGGAKGKTKKKARKSKTLRHSNFSS